MELNSQCCSAANCNLPKPSPPKPPNPLMASGRRRRGGRGSNRAPPPARAPPSPPQEPPPFLLPGGEVEVRVDGDGYFGTWYRGTVRESIPAAGRRSVPRATVVYSDLLDDGGGPLEETLPLSHIRPRPPPPESSPSRRFLLHDIVEAFDKGGWWSGIVMAVAATTVSVAFPVTREVIQFDPGFVRLRRDYIGGEWVPSQSVIALQPKCPVRLYQVDDKVEVVRTHDLYGGCSWFPATVVKIIDPWSYIVEYIDQEEANDPGEKAVEYLSWKFIRPSVDHSPADSKFCFKPGAAVEAYCDGSWSPGVVHRVIGEGEYEIKLNGKGRELVIKLLELLKPHYKWDGNDWKIVSVPKRHTKLRLRSASGKRRISHCHDPEYPSIKKSRKGLPHQEHAVILTDVSEHALVCEMDTAPANNDSQNSCSQLSGHIAPSKESVANVDETDRNHEILCNIVHSENERVETHPMQALQGKNDVPDKVQIQLMEKNSIPNMEISRALSVSPKRQTILLPSKQVLIRTNSSSNMKVYAKKSSRKKCFEVLTSPQSSLSLDQNSARLLQLSSSVVEATETQTQQQPHKTLKDTLNTDKVINQELSSEYNKKGIDIHDNLLEEESTAMVIGSCQSTRNAAIPTDIAVTQVSENNHHTELSVPSVENVLQGGDVMEERSECTISNTVLKSTLDAGSSTLSDLTLCQNADHELPFVKKSKVWPQVEAILMDIFKEVPQRPHFLPLRKFPLVFREIMALGLMTTFPTLVEKIKKSSIGDSMASFEENLEALDHLEKNGFSVQSLRSSLNKLLEIKSAYEKHLKEEKELNAQMLKKMTSLSQINLLLDENEKAMEELRCKGQEIAMKKEHEDAELSKLKAADMSIKEACGGAEFQFRSVLTELQRKTLT